MCLSNLQTGEPKSVARIVPCIGTGQQLHPHSNATHRVFPALMALNVGKPLVEEFAAKRSRHREIMRDLQYISCILIIKKSRV